MHALDIVIGVHDRSLLVMSECTLPRTKYSHCHCCFTWLGLEDEGRHKEKIAQVIPTCAAILAESEVNAT